MKFGAENKTKLYIMVGLFLLALFMIVRPFLSSSAPANTVAASVPNQIEGANQTSRGRGKGQPPPLDPTLRTDLLKNSEEANYKGRGRNIFEVQAEVPKTTTPVVQTPPPLPPPPLIPGPPPIPLKFYGFANKPGQPKSIFLANGDDIFIGKEGDIVNRRYKILRIQSNQVEIEDVLNNSRQSIPLTQG